MSRSRTSFSDQSDQSAVNFDKPLSKDFLNKEQELFSHNIQSGIHFDEYDSIQVSVSGRDPPPPMKSFLDIDFGPAINRNIRLSNYTKPTPIQNNSIPIILANRDLMACAQTGSGKTAAFLLPLLMRIIKKHNNGGKLRVDGRIVVHPVALIMSPTRELCVQIFEEAGKFSHGTGVICSVVYGGHNIREQQYALSRGCDLLVATPGRLIDLLDRKVLSVSHVDMLCLDEGDRMLDLGFAPAIEHIIEDFNMPGSDRRQTLFFSATFPPQVQRLAARYLRDYLFVAIGRVGATTASITQHFLVIEDHDTVAYHQRINESIAQARLPRHRGRDRFTGTRDEVPFMMLTDRFWC